MANPYSGFPVTPTSVPQDWVPVSPSATPFASQARAIRADGAGTVTVTTAAGNSRILRFAAGETRLIACTAITAATASDLEIAI